MNIGSIGGVVALRSMSIHGYGYGGGNSDPPKPKPPEPEKNHGVLFSVLGIVVGCCLIGFAYWLSWPYIDPSKYETLSQHTAVCDVIDVHRTKHRNYYLTVMNGGEKIDSIPLGKDFKDAYELEGKSIELTWEMRKYANGRVERHFVGARDSAKSVVAPITGIQNFSTAARIGR